MDIKKWRKGFRDYAAVKSKIMDITDSDGGVISFDDGKPMWDEGLVLQEAAGVVKLCLRMFGIIDEADEKHLYKFIWGYAAYMGVFHVDVDLEVVKDNGADYTVEATANIPNPREDRMIVTSVTSDYFIVGNTTTGVFAHYKAYEYGDGCYIDVYEVSQAEKFDTYEDAVNALVEDEDLRIWMDENPHPEDVRPLKVHKDIKVTNK